MQEELKITQEWDKVFPQSDKVNHQKVTFTNHFGITLVADMYTPKDYTGKLPALAVAGPYGAVKEQASGLYAQEMAERGFLSIAFDPSFTGESGGHPRYMTAFDINVEDFQAAVDYLISLDNVDSEKIGIIGICGWGGMALQTACIDTRIKATIVSTMYDMSRVAGNGYFDEQDIPDVFICANDFVALDVLRTLSDMGKSVPDDVMLFGFDDSQESRIVTPKLSTVHIHTQVMAFSAMHLLISRIREPSLDFRTVYTEAELILRESTEREGVRKES